jgi:hypothetical protein
MFWGKLAHWCVHIWGGSYSLSSLDTKYCLLSDWNHVWGFRVVGFGNFPFCWQRIEQGQSFPVSFLLRVVWIRVLFFLLVPDGTWLEKVACRLSSVQVSSCASKLLFCFDSNFMCLRMTVCLCLFGDHFYVGLVWKDERNINCLVKFGYCVWIFMRPSFDKNRYAFYLCCFLQAVKSKCMGLHGLLKRGVGRFA